MPSCKLRALFSSFVDSRSKSIWRACNFTCASGLAPRIKRDVPLVMGILLLSSVLVLLVSLLVDLIYTRLDPRIRLR